MSIYTRTGDFGKTSLFGGKRVLKSDELIDLYGLLDELSSSIGVVISLLPPRREMKEFLFEIQKDLFTIGSYIAGAPVDLNHIKGRVDAIEVHIDDMDKTLTPLHNFILPGGSNCASNIHVTRSIARRVERLAVRVIAHNGILQKLDKKYTDSIIMYLNRLSDFLFTLARYINKQKQVSEMVWNSKTE